jgi:plasmid maintenance system killer protein
MRRVSNWVCFTRPAFPGPSFCPCSASCWSNSSAAAHAISATGCRITVVDMDDPEELRTLPSWKAHRLTGDCKGAWSLSVTGNLLLTIRIEIADREIHDVHLEDYH